MSVAERESLQHLFHPSILELEGRRLCGAQRLMAQKQGVRKRPAAGSHETFGDLQRGLLLDDATRLGRRATQAAMKAAARYPTPNGFSISCVCIGQPLVDDKPSPNPEECGPNAERWKNKPSKIGRMRTRKSSDGLGCIPVQSRKKLRAKWREKLLTAREETI
mgnify:CR=1 FL=1